MAKKRKGELPSGNIRIKVYDIETKRYKSFTAPTRAEAQAKANEWKQNRRELKRRTTLAEACEGYIRLKEGVLSPSTITGYEVALRRIRRYVASDLDLTTISSLDLQQFVSLLARDTSSKTVANTYGLVASALKMYLPDATFNVTLPAKQKTKLYIPTSSDVQHLLDICDNPELRIAIMFAAIGTMRRGEACAVTFDDVDYAAYTISINKAFVKVDNCRWELKAPKTYESNRLIIMPEDVIECIKALDRKEGFIIGMTPDQLYDRFQRLLKASGLPHFRYHDLRHYAASQLHAYGMPERYIEAMGGWKPGSNVLKRVYENVVDEELKRMRAEYLAVQRLRMSTSDASGVQKIVELPKAAL